MIVHLNEQLVERDKARVDPFDRGFLFGEGIYEGLRAIAWKGSTRIVGLDLHVRRMQQGLEQIGLTWDASRLGELSAALLKANGLLDAFVYWQVTGGAPAPGAPLRHRVPAPGTRPSVFGFCDAKPPLESFAQPRAIKAITCRDIRWELGSIKSISLMGNVWLTRRAAETECDEAVLIRGGDARGRGGIVAEGLATNVILAVPDGHGGTEIVTPALESVPMLAGVTRALLVRWAPEIRERAVREEELWQASEVMFTGTSNLVAGVVELDGRRIGDGKPGPVARRLNDLLVEGYRRGRDLT